MLLDVALTRLQGSGDANFHIVPAAIRKATEVSTLSTMWTTSWSGGAGDVLVLCGKSTMRAAFPMRSLMAGGRTVCSRPRTRVAMHPHAALHRRNCTSGPDSSIGSSEKSSSHCVKFSA